jgi:hypothetical protein
VQSWDTANKATELSDFSVCTTWDIKGKDLYLLNLLRKRVEYPALKRAVREQQSLFNATLVLIEDKASGTQLIQELIADGRHGVTRYQAERRGSQVLDPSWFDQTRRMEPQGRRLDGKSSLSKLFSSDQTSWMAREEAAFECVLEGCRGSRTSGLKACPLPRGTEGSNLSPSARESVSAVSSAGGGGVARLWAGGCAWAGPEKGT